MTACAGWTIAGSEEEQDSGDVSGIDPMEWHLWFRSGGFTLREMTSARLHQRVNRIPGASGICVKDRLLRWMRRAELSFGTAAYGFHPPGFLPGELGRGSERCGAAAVADSVFRDNLWICKPSDLSRGRKISVIRNPRDAVIDQSSVIQRYLARPLCVSGYKFDLRLYVVVTSVKPLRVFLYRDGLARFATRPYASHRELRADAICAHAGLTGMPSMAAAYRSASASPSASATILAGSPSSQSPSPSPPLSSGSGKAASHVSGPIAMAERSGPPIAALGPDTVLRATATPARWRKRGGVAASERSRPARTLSSLAVGLPPIRRGSSLRAPRASGMASSAPSSRRTLAPDSRRQAGSPGPMAFATSTHTLHRPQGLWLHGPPRGPLRDWGAPLSEIHAHLTNSSLNKDSKSFAEDKEGIGQGCKWSILELRAKLHTARLARRFREKKDGVAADTAGAPDVSTLADAAACSDDEFDLPRIVAPSAKPRPVAFGGYPHALADTEHPSSVVAPSAAAGQASVLEDGGKEAASVELHDPLAKSWDAVRSLVTMTCLSLPELSDQSAAKRAAMTGSEDRGCASCFELFGFDVMLDEEGRPWLLEVNASPAVGIDCPTDEALKPALLRDTALLVSAEAQRLMDLVDEAALMQPAMPPCPGASLSRSPARGNGVWQALRLEPAAITDHLAPRISRPLEEEDASGLAQGCILGDGQFDPASGVLHVTSCGPFDPLTATARARTSYPDGFEMLFPFDAASEQLEAQLAAVRDLSLRPASTTLASAVAADAAALHELAIAVDGRARAAARAAGAVSHPAWRGSARARPPPVCEGHAGRGSPRLAPPRMAPPGPLVVPAGAPSTSLRTRSRSVSRARQSGSARDCGKSSAAKQRDTATRCRDGLRVGTADATRRAMRALIKAVLRRYGSWQDGSVQHDGID